MSKTVSLSLVVRPGVCFNFLRNFISCDKNAISADILKVKTQFGVFGEAILVFMFIGTDCSRDVILKWSCNHRMTPISQNYKSGWKSPTSKAKKLFKLMFYSCDWLCYCFLIKFIFAIPSQNVFHCFIDNLLVVEKQNFTHAICERKKRQQMFTHY